MKEFLKKSLISIAIFLIPAAILVGTGFVLYKLGSQFFSDFKKEPKIEISKEGCNWYKDNCPNGWKSSSEIKGEKLGLIFIKADIGKLSLGSEFILSCCKYYYPQTETVVDWGTDECIWEGVKGDCLPEQAVVAPLGEEELLCKMEPKSPSANTLIRRCTKGTGTYYWCCPNK